MATQNIRLKDADGNVLHPETSLEMIQGTQFVGRTPGFFVFGTYETQVDEDAWDDYPAFGVYRMDRPGRPQGITKAFYINNSGNIVAITDLAQFKPMKGYFAK